MGKKLLVFAWLASSLWAGFTAPKTYEITQKSAILDAPNGEKLFEFDAKTRFTSNYEDGDFVKLTGHFPTKSWQSVKDEWWINKTLIRDISPARIFKKPSIATRKIIIEKSRFRLTVIETIAGEDFVVFTTKIGLGIDQCLPADEGGKCYFTEAGEYKVEFKVYDPDGIEWCIPKSMEMEEKYRKDIEAGNRCFRGSLGNYALNIGKTYAIHGTKNESSIGRKISHGCVRVLNKDAEYLYRLMETGDKVIIEE